MRRAFYLNFLVTGLLIHVSSGQTAEWKFLTDFSPARIDAFSFYPGHYDSLLVAALYLYFSPDGGTTWIKNGGGGEEMLVDRNDPPIIYSSVDNGRMFGVRWDLYVRKGLNGTPVKTVTSGLEEPFNLVLHPVDGKTVYYNAGNMYLARASNGGTVFDTVAQVDTTGDYLNSIQFSRANHNRIYVGTDVAIYVSTNSGMNWAKSYSSFPSLWQVTADPFDENVAYASTSYPTHAQQFVVRTTNGGASWDTCYFQGTPEQPLSLVRAYASPFGKDEVFLLLGGAVFRDSIAYMLRSTDKGDSWQRYDYGLNETPYQLAFDTVNARIYSLTATKLYVLNRATDVSPKPKPVPAGFALAQNFPNPFNPSTTISFTVPRTGKVKLTIYDALGRLVAVLQDGVLNAGTYERAWNATVPSGMYFYRLEAAPANNGSGKLFTETKKMILLK